MKKLLNWYKKHKVLGTILLLLLVIILTNSCEDENIAEQTTETTKQEEAVKKEPKTIAVIESDTEKEYKVYDLTTDPNALNNCTENDAIEITGQVGHISQTGTMGAVMQLDLNYDDDWSGYSIEILGKYEDLKDLNKGDTIKIQGIYNGVGKWTLCREGENIGAHKVSYRNIYVIK